jgi:hypothetical protein
MFCMRLINILYLFTARLRGIDVVMTVKRNYPTYFELLRPR